MKCFLYVTWRVPAGGPRWRGCRPAAGQIRAMDPMPSEERSRGRHPAARRPAFSKRTAKAQRRKDCRCGNVGASSQPALAPLDRQPEMQIRAIDPMPSEERCCARHPAAAQAKRWTHPISPRHRRASVQREHPAGISDGGGWSATPRGSSSGACEGRLRENCEPSACTARALAAFGSDGPLERGHHSSADTREFC